MSNTSSTRWFQLRDDIGVTADGNLEPLVSEGLTASVPVMVDGEIAENTHGYKIEPGERLGEIGARIVPGTRMIETGNPIIADLLTQKGVYDEITQPTKTDIGKAAKQLTDAKDEAGTHEPDPLERPQEYAEGQTDKKGA